MAELLFELLTEEIPERMQARAAEDLHRLATEKLGAAGLVFSKAETFVTPRRLTLVVAARASARPPMRSRDFSNPSASPRSSNASSATPARASSTSP